MLTRIKTLIGYAADARWFAEIDEHDIDKPLGYIPRQSDIPSPYANGPSHVVYAWRGRAVISVETKHRRYEVFEVPRSMIHADESSILAALTA